MKLFVITFFENRESMLIYAHTAVEALDKSEAELTEIKDIKYVGRLLPDVTL